MARYGLTLLVLLAAAVAHRTVVSIQGTAAESTSAPTVLNVPSELLDFRQARPDVPVDDSVRQLLETNTILMRDYVSVRGELVQLAIVYAENTRRSLHFPEVCLTGQGWEVSGESAIPVGVLFVGKGLVLQKGDAHEAVIYWFQTGKYCTGNYFLNSFQWAWDKLLLRKPSSMLVRISAPIGRQGKEAAFGVLNDFAAALAPILLETTP
jgi:EpsI family protein